MGWIDRWARECEEWTALARELGDGATAHQVTTEQRKRMLARGERPMKYPDDFTGPEGATPQDGQTQAADVTPVSSGAAS